MKAHYENKIKELEKELIISQEKVQLATKLSGINELTIKPSEIEKTLETHEDAIKIVKNLEGEILTLQKRLKSSIDTKDSAEKNCNTKKSNLLT